MCAPVVLAAMTIAGGVMQANAQQQQANFEAKAAEQNAKLADQQAKDSIAFGHMEELRHRYQVRQLLGKQRATFAANNVDPTSGSALDIAAETADFGEQDSLTIRNNAMRQAWGFQVDANNSRNAANFARYSGKQQAYATLLNAGAKAYGQWKQG